MLAQWQSVYQSFPVNRNLIWLNNCGVAPAGRHVVDRMASYFTDCAAWGFWKDPSWPSQELAAIRALLAELLRCEPAEIALVHHTAEGMTMVSHGLALGPGDRILLVEHEYPSNVYPWEHWQRRGVELEFVPLGQTPDEFLAEFRARLGPRVRVAALTAVHWCTGMPLPLDELARLCHAHEVLLVIDGSQGVGQLPVDMRAWRPCVVCFSAWKWLLGPLGLAVLAISNELLGSLTPVFKGPDAMASSRYFPYQTEYKPTVDRYMYSTPNYNDWAYFRASLELLSSLGFGRVQTRIAELAGYLWRGLEALGFRSAYLRSPEVPSGIVAVERPGLDCARLVRLLQEEGIIARERMGRLRLAPHVYLLESQLEHTLDTIARRLPQVRV